MLCVLLLCACLDLLKLHHDFVLSLANSRSARICLS